MTKKKKTNSLFPKTRNGFDYTLSPKKTKILILGSFPSESALDEAERIGKKHHYYRNKGNLFWSVIYKCIKTNMSERDFLQLGYDYQIKILSKNSICLWDMVKKCLRQGSSDKGIKDAQANDLSAFQKNNVKIIINGRSFIKKSKHCFKGKKYRDFLLEQLSGACLLPQTSSANRRYYSDDKKIRMWKKAINSCK